MKRCWDVVVEALRQEKSGYVLGIPGNPEALYDSLYDAESLETVLVRHEASGAFMDMAYAKLSRRPGICFGSPGPGMGNLIPGVLEAWSGCTPLVVLGSSASTEKEGKGAFQETPQMDLMKPITKWAYRMPSPNAASWAMRRAFFVASAGKPGPVYIDIPFNVGTSKTERTNYKPSGSPLKFRPDLDGVNEAAGMILSSERPIIVAGGGSFSSAASEEIIALAEFLGIPVLTTPSGRGIIPEDHPLSLGLVGLYRTRIGKKVYNASDLVISLGSRNEEFQTAAWTYFPEDAKLIQVDIDPSEIGRNWIPDLALVGDVKLTLVDILKTVSERTMKTPLKDMPRVKSIIEAKEAFHQEVESECRDSSKPLKSKRIVHEANMVFGRGTILVNENGSQDLWSYYHPYYRILDPYDCVAPAEQTCMGLGVAGAIGAKLAKPDRKVICTTGDGAFQMFMKEVPTAVQYSAPVTWIVLNNHSLGWIKLHEKALGERYIAVDFESQPDFSEFGRLCNCHGERIESPDRIRPSLEDALAQNQSGTPAILDFEVDPWDFPDGFKEFQPDIFMI